jgi:hypothetical protein
VQGTCVFDTGCRGARLLVWLILNDRVQPSFIAGVTAAALRMAVLVLTPNVAAPYASRGGRRVGGIGDGSRRRHPPGRGPGKDFHRQADPGKSVFYEFLGCIKQGVQILWRTATQSCDSPTNFRTQRAR